MNNGRAKIDKPPSKFSRLTCRQLHTIATQFKPEINMTKTQTAAAIIILASCSPKLLVPTQADADRAQRTFPGVTLAQIEEGKTLFETHCDKCHALKKPESHTEMEWHNIVPEMAAKAKIDEETEGKILRYVLAMREAVVNKD